mmetsp:Transcript_11032/g.25234  ORF Transcript_11032/g.25234 Transcript_11032/m.25234 type:complete len:339 (-) Transcript_11032:131-1147(-)
MEAKALCYTFLLGLLALALLVTATTGTAYSLTVAQSSWSGTAPFISCLFGTWLLLYSFLLTEASSAPIQGSVLAIMGSSSVFAFAVYMHGWPAHFQAFLAGVVGMLISVIHPMLSAMVASLSLGLLLAGFSWWFLATHIAGDDASSPIMLLVHVSVLMALPCIFFAGFSCTATGVAAFQFVLVPLVGSLLLVVGVAAFREPAALSAVVELLAADEAQSSEDGSLELLAFLGAWIGVCLVGSLLVVISSRTIAKRSQLSTRRDGSLTASLLPGADDSYMPRPNTMATEGLSRHQIICEAMHLPEDADLSHLTESEQKLVRAVRNDPEERDRVMWGGGLY